MAQNVLDLIYTDVWESIESQQWLVIDFVTFIDDATVRKSWVYLIKGKG